MQIKKVNDLHPATIKPGRFVYKQREEVMSLRLTDVRFVIFLLVLWSDDGGINSSCSRAGDQETCPGDLETCPGDQETCPGDPETRRPAAPRTDSTSIVISAEETSGCSHGALIY